jgi:RNA polymerase sigma-70 factor (ECF subfamily)
LKTIIDIITGCIEGDQAYQKMLYDKYRGFALKTVFRYIYSYERAVDVTNDGFVKLFNHFDSFRCDDVGNAEKALMGWVRRVMINTSIDELRRMKMLSEIGSLPENIWDIPDNEQADQLVLYKELILIIKRLPPQYRIVFNMYVIDGYSHYEIADALQIPIGTSKSTLSRARSILQKFIKDEEKVSV